ncbi:hypothetical protein HG530_006128 [Fusarium avenaceum]|nr:hypothetical protein HG530_006128 [Fusarium avenaceum]
MTSPLSRPGSPGLDFAWRRPVLQKIRVTLTDGTAVDHDKGAVVTSSGNYGTGHVLVTARDRDVGVMVLGASDGLNGISDDFSALERESHA